MPGLVVSITAAPGEKVAAGQKLCTLEAMKMETALHALRDATVSQILVAPGQPVDAKDLLVILEPN